MLKQIMIRLGLGVLLVLSLIGFDTSSPPDGAQAQEPATFDCTAVTEIPQSECEALVAFYISTGGDNWINHSGWLQTNTPCTWFGLTCNEGHVTRLELDWNYLYGMLPSEIGDLSYLKVLRMVFNGIIGSIPSEIGNLLQLRELRLTGNGLNGSIPAALGNLTNLEGLFLQYNQLSGPIPRELGKLVNLNRLLLYSNQLSGPIPVELGNMSSLIFLGLEDNQLSGSIPPSLGQLTNLCDLDLSSNQLTGTIPPELGNLTRIGWCSSHAPTLHDARNALSPALRPLSDAGRPPQPNTGYLNLAANHLSGAVPVELGQLTDASGVNIGCNMFSGDLPYAVSHVIRWGSLDFNALTGYDPVLYPHWYWSDCLHRTRWLLRDQLCHRASWAVHGVRPDRGQDGEFGHGDVAAARRALLLPPAHGHGAAWLQSDLRRLLCPATEHGEERVHRGGSLRRGAANADPHANVDS